ncbi:prenyltransferase/squalene oxidase repeat-containing protein [Schlesneria sp.]|uniref:prenyltransferase/squalene oxidase repeat-containing protein n=1 Tax=Schlesneria sp. TaxID=2762018 RepID=UPI002F179798
MSSERKDVPETQPASASPPPLPPRDASKPHWFKSRPPIVVATPAAPRSANWSRLAVVLFVSFLFHTGVLGLCALIVLHDPQLVEQIYTIITYRDDPTATIIEPPLQQPEEIRDDSLPVAELVDSGSELALDEPGEIELDLSDDLGQLVTDLSEIPGIPEMKVAVETSGRMSVQAKRALMARYGGNAASEAAVALGLKWLKHHQMADGSWSFNHSKHPQCKGACSQDGSFAACPTGATGMALLAFLGGGHTHQKGEHQRSVKRGLDFLLKAAKPTTAGLDLRGNVTSNEGMYVQGICTIALCESAAMTRDPRIRNAAERAVEFIAKAQNQNDGGWRYSPGDAGDLSVSGWQIMALKSGYSAKLKIAPPTFRKAEKFLNATQSHGGSRYMYTPDPNVSGEVEGPATPTMTAVGLLCRMYLGWNPQNQQLAKGVAYLDQVKPQPNNMYFNYYATQVMHHWGGEEWTRWNSVMRDHLVRTQHPVTDGHLAGSWDIADPHGGGGGRLYMTCLSIMTLEVYYRHLPIYSSENIKIEF